jgi:hypothetical protein
MTQLSPVPLSEPKGLDAVVTHHRNTFRSGVARFNEILAERLGLPLLSLFDGTFVSSRRPLLSFKISEMSQQERSVLGAVLEGSHWSPEPFLHDWHGTDLEEHLVACATRVWCGNQQVLEHVEPLHRDVRLAFSPGLMLDQRRYQPAEITVFSFGMAHKIRTDMFGRLKLLLDESGKSYAVYVSAANHETASMGDAELVFKEMLEIFGPRRLYFLGNLSDVAIYNQLVSTTFFAAFFDGGVRANNGSIAAAMDHGAVVITNLDAHSPPQYRHMETVIDIEQSTSLPSDLLTLRRLSLSAMQASDAQSWNRLVDLLRDPSAQSATSS